MFRRAAGWLLVVTCAATTLGPAATAQPGRVPYPGEIVVVAGTGAYGSSGDGGPGPRAQIGPQPRIDVGPDGTVYLADVVDGRVRQVGPDGVITTLPGSVDEPGSGVGEPTAVTAGADGSVVIAADRIRKRAPDGKYTDLAGGGEGDGVGGDGDDGGDGGPAREAALGPVQDVAIDGQGQVYLADLQNLRIRKIDGRGRISTIAGGGTVPLDQAEGRRATEARLPGGDGLQLAVDPSGNVYFNVSAGEDRHIVRKVDAKGTLTTVVGQAGEGFSGDGGPARDARIGTVSGMDTDADGNLYLADNGNRMIRVLGTDGVISTIGPVLDAINDLAVGPQGDVYYTADAQVRKIVRSGVTRAEPAPVEVEGRSPYADREPGTELTVSRAGAYPGDLAVDPSGGVYGVDAEFRLYRIDGRRPESRSEPDQPVRTIAFGPDGSRYEFGAIANTPRLSRYYPDGGVVPFPVSAVPPDVTGVLDLEVASASVLYYATTRQVFRVEGGERTIVYHAHPPTGEMDQPYVSGIGVDRTGALYVADYAAQRVVKVDGQGDETLLGGTGGAAGNGPRGGTFDGENAAEVALNYPTDVAVDEEGNVYVGNYDGVHRIDSGGEIITIARNQGDGQGAYEAIGALAVSPHGDLYFSQPGLGRVRVVVAVAEVPGSFPWLTVLLIAGGVLLLVGAYVGYRRYKAKATDPAPDAEPATAEATTSDAANADFGTLDVPNATLGTLDAPNATLGTQHEGESELAPGDAEAETGVDAGAEDEAGGESGTEATKDES